MSSIVVDFEVLPPDNPLDPSPSHVYNDLHGQLGDHNSPLRTGEFGIYAGSASLSPPGGVIEQDHNGPSGSHRSGDFPEPPPPPPPLSQNGASAAFGSGPGGFQASPGLGSHWSSQHAPYDAPGGDVGGSSLGRQAPFSQHGAGNSNGNWQDGHHGMGHMEAPQALSNAELRSRMAQLEQQLASTAAGHHGVHQPDSHAPRSRDVAGNHSVGPEAYDHQGGHQAYDHQGGHHDERLEAAERSAREAQEVARGERLQRQRLESMLKDREQLLVHAKEMWMKESARASKLADALTNAEDKLADQEKRLAEVSARYNTAAQEVRQLRHLFDGPDGGGFGGGFSGSAAQPGRTATPSRGVPSGNGSDGGGTPLSSSRAGLRGAQGVASPAPSHRDDAPLPPPFEAETNADRFRHLCLASDAILYEDDLIQIGIKSEYRDLECQIAVYFGNKSSAALQAFSAQYVMREERAMRLSASAMRPQLEAHDQVVQRVGATCLQPFVEPPLMRVQFLLPDASPRRIQLKFPIVLSKFIRGLELSPDDFFQLWRLQTLALNEATSVVHLAPRLCASLANVARSIVFGGSLRLHHGLDPNPDNFVLAGQVHEGLIAGRDVDYGMGTGEHPTAAGSRGGPGASLESSVALVRVEVGSGRFSGKARVVVRAGDHVVATALCDGIVGQLAMLPANATDTR